MPKNLQDLLSKSPKTIPSKPRKPPGTSTAVRSLRTLRDDPEPDPLADVNYHQSAEAAADEELSALLDGFKQRAAREDDRFDLATDSENWFCVAFQSREQKEKFLQALGWLACGDKYLDGVALAQHGSIDIGTVELSDPVKRGPDKRLRDLVKKRK